ncbi:hypothetical protein TCAL_09076 [Tigriopus californicus]|uniref:LRRCT domain-containing protein n=2 Tax=Tigriopus californicus TaxID=6832 RepID=A0A553NPS0_TIGCA|nr:slit homolog 1 protein-like isoform X2 [Tigriopus californicus]TRY67438.1 hypothetical protein TCAL_09076 [Tigriopus californicus]|eukprot:TCALIF_09076-PA protein Name:"Similar to LRIG1 Leucine-rich repeats and immunoglobulin-like domains protein 1 (Homo sapiens)" AED:0.05 eAED:0.05 QI:0/1/0.5/1/1/0.75/4/91/777
MSFLSERRSRRGREGGGGGEGGGCEMSFGTRDIIIFACFCTILSSGLHEVHGYCPQSCQCDDILRTVECKSTAHLEVIPITLNPMIEDLDLEGNQIRTVDASFQFYGQLKRVNFGFNLISALPDRCFSSQKRLATLNLESNQVKNVSANAFFGLRSLKVLNLRHNNISTLPNSTFVHLIQLEHLDLSWNTIQTIGSNVFEGSEHLLSLNLGHNQVTTLPSQIWNSVFPRLRSLHLGNNDLASLNERAFKKQGAPSELETLFVESANLSSSALGMLAKNLGRHLKVLDVSNNSIDLTIDSTKTALSTLTLLESLKIGGNFLPAAGRQMWEGLNNLKHLDLSHSPALFKIESEAFGTNQKLEQLDLSGCTHLRSIQPNAFRLSRDNKHLPRNASSPRLIKVIMWNMKWKPIGSVPLPGLAQSSLGTLDLSHNFIHCDCHLIWLHQFLRTSLPSNGSTVMCSSPKRLFQLSLSKVEHSSQLKCEEEEEEVGDPSEDYHDYPLVEDSQAPSGNDTQDSQTTNHQALSPKGQRRRPYSSSSSVLPSDFQFLLISVCVMSATLTALGVLILVHCRPDRTSCPPRIHLFRMGVGDTTGGARRSESHQVCLNNQPTTPPSSSVPRTMNCICCDKESSTGGFLPPGTHRGMSSSSSSSMYRKTRRTPSSSSSSSKRYTFTSLHIPLPSTRGIPPFLSNKSRDSSGVYQASGDFEFFAGSTLQRLNPSSSEYFPPTHHFAMNDEVNLSHLDPLPDSSSSSFNTGNTRSSQSDSFAHQTWTTNHYRNH